MNEHKKFVLSSTGVDTIKRAEELVGGWWGGGELKRKTKLYKVVEVYDLKLKFVKRKVKK